MVKGPREHGSAVFWPLSIVEPAEHPCAEAERTIARSREAGEGVDVGSCAFTLVSGADTGSSARSTSMFLGLQLWELEPGTTHPLPPGASGVRTHIVSRVAELRTALTTGVDVAVEGEVRVSS